ncbi:hypothetical protein [Arsenophonus nasoniae]|uniref:Uncharacterized protein n=2 Tax=Arsenophonus nasoniae TaxID=638 RepID=A0AA95K2C9_9GAMM|nr:hypothetical protein [Arsenophonus nasoniae]WGL93975.1 hypothetical protein QE207_01395 [Arsenophonus nasoniae]
MPLVNVSNFTVKEIVNDRYISCVNELLINYVFSRNKHLNQNTKTNKIIEAITLLFNEYCHDNRYVVNGLPLLIKFCVNNDMNLIEYKNTEEWAITSAKAIKQALMEMIKGTEIIGLNFPVSNKKQVNFNHRFFS